MNENNEPDLIKEYRSLESLRIDLTSKDSVSNKDYALHLLKLSKFLINHGESVKAVLSLSEPKKIAVAISGMKTGW